MPRSTSERIVIHRLRSFALRKGRCNCNSIAEACFFDLHPGFELLAGDAFLGQLLSLSGKTILNAGGFELDFVDRVDREQPARHVADGDGDQQQINAPAGRSWERGAGSSGARRAATITHACFRAGA